MIRVGGPADRHRLTELELQCFGDQAWAPGLLESALVDGQVLLADPGQVVGHAIVRVVADVADLDRIAVTPDHRGQGIGAALLQAAIDRARSAGAERLMLEVEDGNASAITLYRRAGLAEIHRRRGYYRTGADALVMELDLR